MFRSHVPLVALGALVALAACAPQSDSTTSSALPADTPTTNETIQVFAAASLTDAFGEIAAGFEAANPGVHVNFDFAGSSDLAAQINEGAPADAFASANETQMQAVGDAVPDPQLFASNTLTIVVAKGNPLNITALDGLTANGIKLVVCAPQVPCGTATEKVEAAAGLRFNPVSEEANVSDVLSKVANGEADAGLVYVTDIARAEHVEGVDFDGSAAAVNNYPIGALSTSKHAGAAAAFVAFVLGPPGQSVLASYGFGSP